MLFAVGGGVFFSSSAQGYSQGLALLFLRPRDEERPMKITPWCQYRLEQSGVLDIQLASRKNRLDRRWASFMCCGRASAGTDGPFPPKVGPVLQPESSNASLISDKIAANYNVSDVERKVCIKSSLKRASENHSVVAESSEVESGSCVADRRKVQWRDACGRELVQIREFECR
ncbi:hypothetical protein KSP39_PZI024461 [Platanthera zijinensis]|uniref:Uncharacterized protein n=1 Tax=Platanthera zijinensis TaxID=2320716 RepID=A0AAP0FT62_9ASPA